MLPPLLTILTLAECTPNMLLTPLILTLAKCPPDTTYPYACVVPSQHCLPSLRSEHALPTCSRHHLSLRSRSALPTCSRHHLSLRFRTTSIVYGGLLAYTMNTIAEIC
ncbi:hypothetical protein O181_123852 [Austropuccinia psidii MF-1]|uniref:Uncharacterized protein n=1 Tax=Austropuccinia psidii MF-1 TaxID=1389203 RepID=A0A9Q3Q5V0_9BASI|nr:hypothetical protein [Austropuccinia psidii MF-1]